MNERYNERALKDFFLIKEELLSIRRSRYREAQDAKAHFTQNS
jgi:hypothetical protein